MSRTPVPSGARSRWSASTAPRSGPRRPPRRVRPRPGVWSSSTKSLRGPLAGVTVVDLGFAVAGPFGTQVLADLGADVIKVNGFRDPWWHAMHIAYGCNRNKRSIGIDLKTAERAGCAAPVAGPGRCGALQHACRRPPSAAPRRGLRTGGQPTDHLLPHQGLRERPPVGLAGATTRPACRSPGHLRGRRHAGKAGHPFWSLTSLGDTGNGFLSAMGVIQALYHRARTGEAQAVDTSILNAGLLLASMASIREDGRRSPVPSWTRCSCRSARCTASTRRRTAGSAWPQ